MHSGLRAFWPYQIRRLIDSGWTVEELARALKTTPDRIDKYAKGKMVPEAGTQRDLNKLLSLFCKRVVAQGNIPPRIVAENLRSPPAPAESAEPERGIYEDLHPPAGQRVFRVISSQAGEVGIVIWPAHWVTPQFIRNLELGLDMRDPPKQLKAI